MTTALTSASVLILFTLQPATANNLTCADGNSPFMLDWSNVSWNGGDVSTTYSNVENSGHDITVKWRVSDAYFRSGRPRIANDPSECPEITGDYCAASTANVQSINAEHAIEIEFTPPVSGVDVTIGDLQDKTNGGSYEHGIIEGISLTKGSATGLTILPGDNIVAGQNRTEYRPTTGEDGVDNSIRYIWSDTSVDNVEFTMLNDNAGPQIYGNALSFNMSGVAFCKQAENPVTLSINKIADKTSVSSGDTLTYTITVQNTGTQNATGVQANDLLPSKLTYQSHAGDGSYNAATGLWNVGSIAAGASKVLNITVLVN